MASEKLPVVLTNSAMPMHFPWFRLEISTLKCRKSDSRSSSIRFGRDCTSKERSSVRSNICWNPLMIVFLLLRAEDILLIDMSSAEEDGIRPFLHNRKAKGPRADCSRGSHRGFNEVWSTFPSGEREREREKTASSECILADKYTENVLMGLWLAREQIAFFLSLSNVFYLFSQVAESEKRVIYHKGEK